jgi:hypothetical protein
LFLTIDSGENRVLTSVCKGSDVTAAKIAKSQPETHFALERVLFGQDGLGALNQKLLELSPHFSVPKV